MGMSNVSSVSLIFLSAAPVILVRPIIIWPLDIKEGDDVRILSESAAFCGHGSSDNSNLINSLVS